MALPPHSDPGVPDSRGPARYLWWLVRRQPGRVLRGSLLSSVWMTGIALEPYFIRGAIDHGLTPGDQVALAQWVAAMAGVALVTALVGMQRHRTMTFVRADAAYRTVQVVTRTVARLGAVLPRRVATGEVVTVGTTDIWQLAMVLTVSGPGVGSLVALVVIAILLLTISPLLGGLVLLGVPVVTVVIGPLLQRLQRTETEYRRKQGELTARASDIVAGLRVLRGIGGEELFAAGYRQRSQALQREGYRVGAVTSWVRALATGVPGFFVALVAWLAARLVVLGEITVGDLVAIFAFAAVLAIPISFIIEGGQQLVRALVSARRVVNLLNLRPAVTEPETTAAPPPAATGDLHDPVTGLAVPTGALVGVVAADQAAVAALADRLGRHEESPATLAGVPISQLPVAQVRERILVAEGDAYLFAGALRDLLCPRRQLDEATIARCLRAAAADEIVAGLPDRLETRFSNRAHTLSGGQRQRIRLARALLADPEVLILLEPTSAVDAHTEAAIADQLRQVRAGRTTVVATSSPLLLDRADRVAFLSDGRVAATGTHAELLTICPDYRALVTRGGGAAAAAAVAGEAPR